MRTRTLRSRLMVVGIAMTLVGAVAVGALAQGAGKSLIGKLEGPEVVTDAAKAPKSFHEKRPPDYEKLRTDIKEAGR